MVDKRESPRIAIIGAGMSGICCAIQLKKAGFNNLQILEKSPDVGGTWLENSYPNAGCDVPSHLYSYSFAPKYDWSEKYARQPEILQYFRDCVSRFDLQRNIRFNSTLQKATYDEQTCSWNLTVDGGPPLTAEILVCATGQLNRPSIPQIEGLEQFEGAKWHSARWDESYCLKNKRVAIIGSGASTIQFLPEVVKQASNVLLFQRSPNYIKPLRNYRYPEAAKLFFKLIPGVSRLYRLLIFLGNESRFALFIKGSWLNREAGRWIRRRMKKQLPDCHHADLLPQYPVGCKRILQSNDYLSAVIQPHVQVVTSPITRVLPHSICTGQDQHQVDAIIFGTGFEAQSFGNVARIRGVDSWLHEAWKDRPQTMLGITASGFPNLFFLYGPNTNLGHNSIIYMVENQVSYLIRCLRHMRNKGWDEIEVSDAAVKKGDQELQRRLDQTVWTAGCNNWYTAQDGNVVNNWSGTALSYGWKTRRPNFAHYAFRRRNQRLEELPKKAA